MWQGNVSSIWDGSQCNSPCIRTCLCVCVVCPVVCVRFTGYVVGGMLIRGRIHRRCPNVPLRITILSMDFPACMFVPKVPTSWGKFGMYGMHRKLPVLPTFTRNRRKNSNRCYYRHWKIKRNNSSKAKGPGLPRKKKLILFINGHKKSIRPKPIRKLSKYSKRKVFPCNNRTITTTKMNE